MALAENRYRQAVVLFLCLQLFLPPAFVTAAAQATPAVVPAPIYSSQLVILIPDLFDSTTAWDRAIRRLVAGGILRRDIVSLPGYPGYDRRAGLQEQAEALALIVERESARRGGIRAHLIAKGSGGLVARVYLLKAKQTRVEGAPVEEVVALGVPHRGRAWAKWAYALALPLPGVGMRAPALADLAPDSPFMRRLNAAGEQVRGMIREARELIQAGDPARPAPSLLRGDEAAFTPVLQSQLDRIDRARQGAARKLGTLVRYPEQVQFAPEERRELEEMARLRRPLERVLTALSEKPEDLYAAGAGAGIRTESWQRAAADLERRVDAELAANRTRSERELGPRIGVVEQAGAALGQVLAQSQLCLQKALQSAASYPSVAGATDPLSRWDQAVRRQTEAWSPARLEPALAAVEQEVERQETQARQAEAESTRAPAPAAQAEAWQQHRAAWQVRQAWDAMDEARQAWLQAGKGLVRARQAARAQAELAAYRQRLPEAKELRAQPDSLLPGLSDPGGLKKERQAFAAGHARYAQAAAEFRAALAQATPEQGRRLVQGEYLYSQSRFEDVGTLLMACSGRGPEEFAMALAAAERGGAAQELELFARASRRRLARELDRLEQGWDELRRQRDALEAARQRVELRELLARCREEGARSAAELQQAQRLLAVSLLLRQAGELEQVRKRAQAQDANDPDLAAKLQALAELSAQRRRVVSELEGLAQAAIEQLKTFDAYRFAGLAEANNSSPSRGEDGGAVQTGYTVYKLDRAHGLQVKPRARRKCLCPGKRPVPWMNG